MDLIVTTRNLGAGEVCTRAVGRLEEEARPSGSGGIPPSGNTCLISTI